MKPGTSLNSRLVFSHLLVSLVSIIMISVFAGSAIFNAAIKDVENNLEDLAFSTGNALELPLYQYSISQGDLTTVRDVLDRLLSKHEGINYTLYRTDGTPILDNSGVLPAPATRDNSPEVLDALQDEMGEAHQIRNGTNGERMFFVAVRIQRENQAIAVLRLDAPLASSFVAARNALGLLALVGVLVALSVSLFGWILATNISGPIQNLTKTAERLAGGDMGARVTPSGPQELHRLAEVFNTMAGRLQDHVDELRAFVANASHELRTPLTVVKLRTEALRSGAMEEPVVAEQFLAEIESEVDRLGRMVNDLLDLSRMEAGLISQKRSLINMGTIATEVYETFSIRAARAGLKLNLDIEPDLPEMMGNEDQLRRVLYNFIDNAIKFTQRDGEIDVFLRSGRKGKTVRVLVKDTGPGITAEDLPHIFERFYRVEATRPRYGTTKGSGLGMAIAKSIVENHGGKIGVSSQVGKGSTFWAEIPTHT
ncbi:MAG: HAMP domain-containing sensor histidine kinase [Anaerolineales bacterium]|jgi:signal transduction histidine kinase